MGNCFSSKDETSNEDVKWKSQELCHLILERITGQKFQRDGFYDWLINPKTGRPLQLDSYNSRLGIALEYNGIQHYKYPNVFHKSKEEFSQQRKRDQLKVKLCKEKGVHLIVVPYTIKNTELEQYIRDNMPTRGWLTELLRIFR